MYVGDQFWGSSHDMSDAQASEFAAFGFVLHRMLSFPGSFKFDLHLGSNWFKYAYSMVLDPGSTLLQGLTFLEGHISNYLF